MGAGAINREQYDLSHWSMGAGRIGRLQTLALIPVVGGDSISLDMNSVFRLSPLRRNMYMDAQIDLFAFYVPHRHIYGADWISFMKSGPNEAVTFGTRTMTGSLFCCGTHVVPGTVPKWIPEGYIGIWNRYFKNPSRSDLAVSFFDGLAEGDNSLVYGIGIGHLPRIWNTGVQALTVAGDKRVQLVDTDKIDLVDVASKQGQLEQIRKREFFARRYNDVMSSSFGADNINTDADQRPTLLMHAKHWLSGHDVNGTDDATLGTYTGKGASVGSLSFPWKFIPEHGAIWIMAAVRFPPVHLKEIHYLVKKSEPTYAQISGDPDLFMRQAPVTLNLTEYFANATLTDAGQIPYGQWYREQPNYVHNLYSNVSGHPFLEEIIAGSDTQVEYISGSEYDNVFQSTPLGHWQSQGHLDVLVKRVVPDPRNSIFAGTL